MMNDDPGLDRALTRIGARVGRDGAYFAPADEQHFDPITVGVVVGAYLMRAFLKGFVGEVTDRAEELGREAARALEAKVFELFASPDPTPAPPSAAVQQDIREAADAASGDPSSIDRHARAAQNWLENELASSFSFPERRAQRLAEEVRGESIEQIVRVRHAEA